MCPFQLQPLNMYVERTHLEKLDVYQTHKCGQLLLEITKMHGLNEFNRKKMCPEEKKDNAPSIISNLSLNDKMAIRFMMKKTESFDYSKRMNNDEGAEQNYFEDKEMNGIQGEGISNISPWKYRLLCARLTQKKTPKSWKNTTTRKSKSDFVFLKPKVYQCHYCQKLFFHTSTYRRHMINQLKKVNWCSICKRGFLSVTRFRKHKLFCYTL